MLLSIATSRRELVAALQRSIHDLEEGRHAADERPVSSGLAALDRLLPRGGLGRGTLIEWFATTFACGTASLALAAARGACGADSDTSRAGSAARFAHDPSAAGGSSFPRCFAQSLVVIDRAGEFYPPAAALLGIDLAQTIVVRPLRAADAAWALDQSLRSPSVGAVLSWEDALDDLTFRRWQLAAEEGGSLGLLLRPASCLGEPSWADVRWLVRPQPSRSRHRRLCVELLSAPGALGAQKSGALGAQKSSAVARESHNASDSVSRVQTVEVEIDDETGALRQAAELASATVVARARRAR